MYKLTIFLLLFSPILFSQTDMTAGYEMLEKGKLEEAAVFFGDVVKEWPENKTANICLGRAVGLSGDPIRALEIFAEADKIYPGDFELGLNIAEAYLWNERPDESLEVYQSLLVKDQNNYTANLGTANSYYELEDYEKALEFIDIAIALQPKNKGTYNSKKYILLALAAKKTAQYDYRAAIDQFNLILEFMPLDGLALINKGINFINLENYKLAEHTFQTLLDNEIALVETNILMSHLSMLRHKDKESVFYAEQAVIAAASEDDQAQLRAGIQKVNALGASKSFKEAFVLLDELSVKHGDETDIKMAYGRLNVWDREAPEGLKVYNEFTEESFAVHMGKAEAYNAMMQSQEAIEALDAAIALNPNSLDAMRLKREILAKKKMSVEVGSSMSSDDGLNEANDFYARINIPAGEKHIFHVHTGLRQTSNQSVNSSADQYQLFVGDRIQLHRLWTLTSSFGTISHQNEEQGRSLNSIAMGELKYQFHKNHAGGISYNRESLKYSSDLIRSGLINNRFSTSYQYGAPKRPGFFTQVNRSYFNDGNTNFNVFASLFYEIKSFPLIKLGVNATHLTFKEEKPSLYFSPDLYQMGELFLQVGNNYDTKAKFTYSGLIGFGKQRVANNDFENTRRVDIQVGYKFKSKIYLSVNYFTNSAATSNVKGYSFRRFGVKLNKAF